MSVPRSEFSVCSVGTETGGQKKWKYYFWALCPISNPSLVSLVLWAPPLAFALKSWREAPSAAGIAK